MSNTDFLCNCGVGILSGPARLRQCQQCKVWTDTVPFAESPARMPRVTAYIKTLTGKVLIFNLCSQTPGHQVKSYVCDLEGPPPTDIALINHKSCKLLKFHDTLAEHSSPTVQPAVGQMHSPCQATFGMVLKSSSLVDWDTTVRKRFSVFPEQYERVYHRLLYFRLRQEVGQILIMHIEHFCADVARIISEFCGLSIQVPVVYEPALGFFVQELPSDKNAIWTALQEHLIEWGPTLKGYVPSQQEYGVLCYHSTGRAGFVLLA
eukprot:TRINITY_DN67868_c7_g1_i1.p1 TRINITY_DN67868_c7_g1~~TRINITY_DN67868_c7_g1_i1.p1  ORF type:complete len:263 (-),score=-0.88 TRINITY_DN67868_c7_g1_i1:59-847(-)